MNAGVLSDSSDWFWEIIQQAGKSKERLGQLLSTLDRDRLYRFAWLFTDAATQLQDDDYQSQSEPGTSEDDFEFIVWWVVSQGKEAYVNVLLHPEQAPSYVEMHNQDDILYGVAEKLYRETFGDINIWRDYHQMY